MDSEEETLYDDVDSGNESSGDDVDFAMEIESGNPRERATDVDEYPFEVLSTEEIVQHMVDSIKEVNTVVEVSLVTYRTFLKINRRKICYSRTLVNPQIPATTTRILLNHFKWDKEKLMERFYDGDQEKLFAEARVINPFRKGPLISRSRSSQSSLVNVRV